MSVIAVIGSGFSGLSAAAYLSKEGHEVHVFEKNDQAGGRARQLVTDNGFRFDMGPSWYWMPDVFEKFFSDFGKRPADFFDLRRLDPAFDIVFGDKDTVSIPAGFDELKTLFESIEPGSASKLDQFMKNAELKYRISFDELIYKPGISLFEFTSLSVLRNSLHLNIFSSFSKYVRKYFSHPKLIALMEFPVLFLGAMPKDTPALYSLMNYAGLKLGTWYPMGGFKSVVNAMVSICEENGVKFHLNTPVEKIITGRHYATGIMAGGSAFLCDGIIASADYRHVEKQLLTEESRNYTDGYWDSKTLAPSSLIYYLGINKKLDKLQHHTLFFDEDLEAHARAIYKDPSWPDKPQFYVSCPSRTDAGVAPEGGENIFLLMPIAPGLEDNDATREKYFRIMLSRLEKYTGEKLGDFIIFKKSYCVNDFISDYNSFRGNAYGLANTLSQTAVMKPGIRNKKIRNLYYAGQLTVPGPGVPPSIISGKIAASQLNKHLTPSGYEAVIR